MEGITDVLAGRSRWAFHHGSCLDFLPTLPEKSIDLVFGSPPYEDQRTYGIGFRLKGQAWVDWMVEITRQAARVCKGLVAWVVEGKTEDFRWSASPALLMADLHRAGFNLRHPALYHRHSISGSGGPDWLRNDFEFIICITPAGRLAWSENTAMGHVPLWAPGGAMSHRLSDGTRRNQWGKNGATGARRKNGSREKNKERPGHKYMTPREATGEREDQPYEPPAIANPGNVVHCKVGGNQMGSRLCHENEAPFPERLPEFFIRSFCPPDGIVSDPFLGSGTTAAMAVKWHRRALGCDVREDQIELSRRRILGENPVLPFGEMLGEPTSSETNGSRSMESSSSPDVRPDDTAS